MASRAALVPCKNKCMHHLLMATCLIGQHHRLRTPAPEQRVLAAPAANEHLRAELEPKGLDDLFSVRGSTTIFALPASVCWMLQHPDIPDNESGNHVWPSLSLPSSAQRASTTTAAGGRVDKLVSCYHPTAEAICGEPRCFSSALDLWDLGVSSACHEQATRAPKQQSDKHTGRGAAACVLRPTWQPALR
jgi:hypothetical protein